MKILVTGATGFLGRNVCRILSEKGYSILATGRDVEIGKEISKLKNVKFISGDLNNIEFCDRLMKNCYKIVHCAALSSPYGRYKDFYNANIVSTSNLIQSALKNNICKFVHISTPSIYFDYTDKSDIKETDPLPKKFVNYYAETKYEAEKLVRLASVKETMDCIILRPRAIFGKDDTTIIPRFLKANARTGVPFIRNGNFYIDITYVENVVHAIELSLNSTSLHYGKAYNITNAEPVLFKDLIELIFKRIGIKLYKRKIPIKTAYLLGWCMEKIFLIQSKKEPPLTKYSIGVLSCNQTLSIELAKKELGYKPIISLYEGLETTLKALEKEV